MIVLLSGLALTGCSARDIAAIADRPLLSVETRLSCAIDEPPAEAATRGPHRGYDGEAMPSAPAPASADSDIDGVTPRRGCEAGERIAALMPSMPTLTVSIDATGALAFVEAGRRDTAHRPPPLQPAVRVAPPPANRAAEAAARLAAAAQGRPRQAR